jgi:hypothetical protein
VPFLWAESCFYRRLLDAVDYFEPGPWQGIDPFEPAKRADLDKADPAVLEDLDEQALLRASLWGNQADLGFLLSSKASDARNLIVDDSALMWSLLGGEVGFVADNAGRELLPDLVLIDHLLHSGRATKVTLHVKPHPYFVSDAVTADVIACLRRLTEMTRRRLWDALATGRLTVNAHPFHCAPLSYHHMPVGLFAEASLTIMKGDLNYRRLVGDCSWPATIPFDTVTEYFPGPVVALRTLKCDVVTGLPEDVLTALDASGKPWRTTGTHAVIQVGQSSKAGGRVS